MFAAVDLGSNSFHLLIASVRDGELNIVERYSERVQLGENLTTAGRICDAAMQRGLACLDDFSRSLEKYDIEVIRCYGTNALRVAANRDDFIAQAAARGFPVEVISGEREAELIYQGVTGRQSESKKRCLVFDIGGGSTEFAIGKGRSVDAVVSLDLGCVSWRDTYFADGSVKRKSLEAAIAAAQARVEPVRELLPAKLARVYASSGTAKMLCSIARELGQPANVISEKSLKKVGKQIFGFDKVDDIVLPGLKPQRQDVLLPGFAIMRAILSTLALEEVQFSSTAMREGMLFEMGADAG